MSHMESVFLEHRRRVEGSPSLRDYARMELRGPDGGGWIRRELAREPLRALRLPPGIRLVRVLRRFAARRGYSKPEPAERIPRSSELPRPREGSGAAR